MADAQTKSDCKYCNADVSDLRIKCAECPEDFNLCPQCFACGVEIGPHKHTHSYSIFTQCVDSSDPAIFSSPENWKASDELKLFNTLRRSRFPDWDGASKEIGSKSAQEVENHYLNMYVHGNIGKVTQPMHDSNYEFLVDDCTASIAEMPENTSKPDLSTVPVDIRLELGYNPNTQFFADAVYDGGAEAIFPCRLDRSLQSQDYDNNEKDIHNVLELACVNIYRGRLKRRYAMERLASDYNLIKEFSDSLMPESNHIAMDKTERELRNQTKVFCRLLEPNEYEALIQGEIEEKKMKAGFKQLKKKCFKHFPPVKNAAKNSATKVEQVRGKQNKSKENKHKKDSSASLPSCDMPVEKEIKTSSSTSSNKSRKRPFQEENMETLYSANCRDLLSQAEKKLCSNLDLEPSSYMALKIVLLKERNIMMDNDTSNPICNPPSANSAAVQKVSNFMSKSGWIKAG